MVFCGYEEDSVLIAKKRYESVEEYKKEWEDDFYRLVGIKYGILVGEEVVDEISMKMNLIWIVKMVVIWKRLRGYLKNFVMR